MKLAITGLSNSGKTTVFNALTGKNIETAAYATASGEPHLGMVRVPDARVDRLAEIFKPKKVTHAVVEYVDYIGLTKGDVNQNNKVFELIKDSDALVHVVRAFSSDSVPHPLNNIDPMRDIETVQLECIFGDLEFVEKRLERMEDGAKRGKKPNEAEKKLMLRLKEALESERPLRIVAFDEEEHKIMRNFQLASTKPEIIVLNVGEDDLASGKAQALLEEALGHIEKKGLSATTRVVTLCGKIEMEIAQLPPEEAKAFFDDLGIAEPALFKLIKESYSLLGLISFLTAGEDECRAWTIKKGLAAQQAAGKVHSDIERGFIRAETVGYDDFIADGSMSAARDKGHLRLEGKTYEVKDGDIINFRFNV
jgi:ribosome-binding ATPase